MTSLDTQEYRALDDDPILDAHLHFAATPDGEERYWHAAYERGLWSNKHYLYEDFSPAYSTGYLHRMRHQEQPWEEAERELRIEWDEGKGVSRLGWDDVWPAIQAAWQHASGTTVTITPA